MLRTFTRNAPAIRKAFVTKTAFNFARAMATSKADNEQLERSKLFDVSHVTAVVTGGNSGIGLMITRALVANGAKVYMVGLDQDGAEKTAVEYNTGPGKIIPLSGDVSSKDEAQRLAREVAEKESNGIQLLVNNAGTAMDNNTHFQKVGQPDMSDAEAISKHFIQSESQHWLDTMNINVVGGYFMAMAFLPLLAKGGEATQGYSSSIVNVSSMSAFLKESSGGQFAYSTSKAAFTHLSRMLATTFKDVKVRVNIIAPGVFPSQMTQDSDEQDSQLETTKTFPARRPGSDADMAATILFLAGPSGVYYNEQILLPDGGATLVSPAAKM